MGVFGNLFGKDKKNNELRFYTLVVDDIFKMKTQGCVAVGLVKDGAIRVNDKICVSTASGEKLHSKVSALEFNRKPVKEIPAGYPAAVLLQNISADQIHKGDIISHTNEPF